MRRKAGRGLLFVMIEVTEGAEDELDRWYETEHLPDRSNCAGFLSARRFYNLRADEQRYLALYHMESPQVLDTEAYKAIFMTPWTERIRTFYARPSVRSVYVEVAPFGVGADTEVPDTTRTGNRGLVLEMIDVAPQNEGMLDIWYETEHLPSWRAIPGFLGARRFVKVEGAGSKWLSVYNLDSEAAATSGAAGKIENFVRRLEEAKPFGKPEASHRLYREIAPLDRR